MQVRKMWVLKEVRGHTNGGKKTLKIILATSLLNKDSKAIS